MRSTALAATGIFRDSPEEDVPLLSNVVELSLRYYKHYCDLAPERGEPPPDFEIQVSTAANFEGLSDMGGRLRTEFGLETPLERVGILLILTNATPWFAIYRNKRICMDPAARKQFLSIYTCFLVQAGLYMVPFFGEHQERILLAWKAFPSKNFADRFLNYLQWVPSGKLVIHPSEKGQREGKADYERQLAHLCLGCALALESCVERRIAAATPTARQIAAQVEPGFERPEI